MRRILVLSVCIGVLLSGCFKEKRETTLNPNGSGKMQYEIVYPLPFGGEDVNLKEEAQKNAEKIMADSKGISAWKDVSYGVTDKDQLYFKGTAYFKDIAKLAIGGSVKSNINLQCRTDADGITHLELVQEEAPTPPEAVPQLTEEEIQKKIADAKAQMKQTLPMMSKAFEDARIEYTFVLPDAIEKSVNFETLADRANTVRIVYDGKKLLEVMKTLSDDDEFLRNRAIKGQDASSPIDPRIMNEKLFGQPDNPQVSFKAGEKPLFDWDAEVAAEDKPEAAE